MAKSIGNSAVFEDIKTAAILEKDAVKDLKDVLNHIDDASKKPGIKAFVAAKLQDAKDKELFIAQEIDYIVQMNKRLETCEIDVFDKLNRKFAMLSDEGKKQFRQVLEHDRQKIIREEKAMDEYLAESKQYCTEFVKLLDSVAGNIDSGSQEEARKSLLKAIETEEKILKLMTEIKVFEIRMLLLMETELVIR